MPIERVDIAEGQQFAADRNAFIGASEVPIVCGESSYGSLAELYAEKKGLRPPLIADGIMRRGRYGEAAVFEALATECPTWTVRRAKVHVRDTERRLACTPDGFATQVDNHHNGIGIVQAKVISRSIFRDRWLDDPSAPIDEGAVTVPSMYRLQVVTEMMLNDLHWGVLAVLINGEFDWQFRTFDIERDAAIEDRILYHVEKFWREHLDPNIMPAFQPQRDGELIKALFPKDDGSAIDLSTDNRALALADDLQHLQDAKRRLADDEFAIKAELTAKLADHSYGALADGRWLSWKQQHRKSYTVAAADYRVLRVLAHAPKGVEQ